jgi:hypothetical protein
MTVWALNAPTMIVMTTMSTTEDEDDDAYHVYVALPSSFIQECIQVLGYAPYWHVIPLEKDVVTSSCLGNVFHRRFINRLGYSLYLSWASSLHWSLLGHCVRVTKYRSGVLGKGRWITVELVARLGAVQDGVTIREEDCNVHACREVPAEYFVTSKRLKVAVVCLEFPNHPLDSNPHTCHGESRIHSWCCR